MAKTIYFFGAGQADGDATMKNLLGGKGAGLAEMSRLGVPVPPGFTLTTEVCTSFYAGGGELPPSLEEGVREAMARVEPIVGGKFGGASEPLLVSVRSGARASMPGMMDTILNLGLNDEIVRGLAARTGNERFALDAYRRFIVTYAGVVMGVERDRFEEALVAARRKAASALGVDHTRLNNAELERKVPDSALDPEALRGLIQSQKEIFRAATGQEADTELLDLLRFEDGLIVSFKQFADTALAARLLGA